MLAKPLKIEYFKYYELLYLINATLVILNDIEDRQPPLTCFMVHNECFNHSFWKDTTDLLSTDQGVNISFPLLKYLAKKWEFHKINEITGEVND